MERRIVAAATLTLVLAACTTSATTATTKLDPRACRTPPESELDVESPFPLSVTPSSVQAGSAVTLDLGEMPGVEIDHGVTPQLSWQCWNGSEWIDTHQITRDGPTVEIAPDATVTSIATLTFVPDDFQITIPDVAPGWYRIEDLLLGQTGYLIVEVVGSAPEAESSRWEWILSQTVTDPDSGGLQVFEQAAREPAFDYERLGEEQPWVTTAGTVLATGNPGAIDPRVYVGTILRSGVSPPPSVYTFQSDGGAGDPDQRQSKSDELCVEVVHSGGSLRSCLAVVDVDRVAEEGSLLQALSATPGTDAEPEGELLVTVIVPRSAAVVLLLVNDARSYVQRPSAGIAVFAIPAVEGSWLERLDVLDAEGELSERQELSDVHRPEATTPPQED